MSKTQFHIGSDSVGAMNTPNTVVRFIHELPLDKEWDITVEPHKKDRSVQQNALFWKWMTVIGGEVGMTKQEMRDEYVGQFLVPIFTRDDPEYAELWEAVRDVWRGGDKDGAMLLRKNIVRLTSTTHASVKQMSEMMEDIERDAISKGIYLPAPEYD